MDKNTVRLMAVALAVFNLSAIIPVGYTIVYLVSNDLKLEFLSVVEMFGQIKDVWLLYLLPFFTTAVIVYMTRQLMIPRKIPN